jgi:hypothetical protein
MGFRTRSKSGGADDEAGSVQNLSFATYQGTVPLFWSGMMKRDVCALCGVADRLKLTSKIPYTCHGKPSEVLGVIDGVHLPLAAVKNFKRPRAS